ncbi:MAG: hypothetical protein VX840_13670, partial [Pseudomonadota bacterium]|nr:hypothetical protein [Pseudomonadota bacterium]
QYTSVGALAGASSACALKVTTIIITANNEVMDNLWWIILLSIVEYFVRFFVSAFACRFQSSLFSHIQKGLVLHQPFVSSI